jgi:hypothetical protein
VDSRVAILRIIERSQKEPLQPISSFIVESLQAIFPKETNELAISAMTDAIMTHQAVLLEKDIVMEDKVTKLVIAGLSDKRLKVKAGWAVSVSSVIWDAKTVTPALIAFSKNVAKGLFNVFNEVANNGLQAIQNGTIAAGYAISAATVGRWFAWQDTPLGTPF